MSEKLLHEIEHELEASKKFTRMSIVLALSGFPNAAEYFLSVAREDQEHAGRYAQLYEQLTGSPPKVGDSDYSMDTVTNIMQKYEDMENGGVERISEIKKEIDSNLHPGIINELDDFANEHAQEKYKAKKMKERIAKMSKIDGNIHDIDEFFEDILENKINKMFKYNT